MINILLEKTVTHLLSKYFVISILSLRQRVDDFLLGRIYATHLGGACRIQVS